MGPMKAVAGRGGMVPGGGTKAATRGGLVGRSPAVRDKRQLFADGGLVKPPFEQSKRDVEKKGMREGSKREEAMDARQKKAPKGKAKHG